MWASSKSHLAALAVSVGLLLGAVPAPSLLQNWQVGAAQVQLSHVMMLAERLSKQNLLYQLRLGEVRKEHLVETAAAIDAALRVLYEGNALLGVPKPPTVDLRKQIDRVDAQWGLVRAMAVASPYDYVRRSGTQPGDKTADPLLVRHFDELVSKMIQRANRAQDLYNEICLKNELPDCVAMRAGPATTMLSERMLKEAIFIYAEMDAERNRAGLVKTRARLAKAVEHKDDAEMVLKARSPKRGTAGKVVGGMRRDIDAHWETLRRQVDLVLEGPADEFDLLRALGTQRQLVSEYQRYTIAIIRFGSEQRAHRAAATRD